jgi:hypothetical protein
MARNRGSLKIATTGIAASAPRCAFRFTDKVGAAWCLLMHDAPRWPIRGHYICGICGRRYRVPWAEVEPVGSSRVQNSAPVLS